MTARERLAISLERPMVVGLAALPLLAVLAFGGLVWWARPLLGALTASLGVGQAFRILLSGRLSALRSPLTALGVLALALAAFQLVPLPGPIARRLSPEARDWHVIGLSRGLAEAHDPGRPLPEDAGTVRSPTTLDRTATLRWALGGLACLAAFLVASQLADRPGRTLALCGCLAAGVGVNTAIGLVQAFGGVPGAYGLFRPGSGPWWAPSALDAWETPLDVRLHPVDGGDPTWLAPRVPGFSAFGTMVGGPGAYLALASLGLPVLLGLSLHLIAPRGSSLPLAARLAEAGQGSGLAVLLGLGLATAGLVGFLAGPWLSLPFAVALAVVGLYAATGAGAGRLAVGLTTLFAVALAGGAALGASTESAAPLGLRSEADSAWSGPSSWPGVLRVVRDYPLVGVGLGGFPAVEPLYRGTDADPGERAGALGRWVAEAGVPGLAILGLAGLWCVLKLPGALRAVEPADRALPAALLGGVVGLAAFSAVHWSVDGAAIALSGSVLMGAANRWLAGGTDLFVEAA